MKTKSIAALFIATILIMLSVSSLADGFTYRNGITFGMTRDEIKKLETLKIDSEVTNKWLRYGPAEIAGIKNSTIEYHFDNGKLASIYISFDKKPNPIKISTVYDDINRSLVEKYGMPLENKNGKTYVYRGSGLDKEFEFQSLGKLLGKKYDIYYDEWALEQEDGIVKIDHYYTKTKGNTGTLVYHNLEYTFFSNADKNSHSNDL